MKNTLILFALILTLFGCKEDFEPNADWEEITVIYGILDPSQEKQYIKVNKGFQNRDGGNALEIAKNEDSLYHADSIKVELLQYDNQDVVENTYILKREYITKKEDGTFYSEGHWLYTIPTSDINYVSNRKFKVIVTNLSNGKQTYADTKTLSDLNIYKPNGPSNTFALYNKFSQELKDEKIKLKRSVNAGIYQIVMNVTYLDIIDNDTINIDTVKYYQSNNYYLETFQDSVEINVPANTFIQSIVSGIDTKNDPSNLTRKFGIHYVEFIASTYEMADYINAENNFSGLSQNKPFYTNVFDLKTNKETAGLFANRLVEEKVFVFSIPTEDYIKETYPLLKFE